MQGSQFESAVAVAMRVVILREGLAMEALSISCLLYTSDAADDLLCVDLGGRRIIKKKIEITY